MHDAANHPSIIDPWNVLYGLSHFVDPRHGIGAPYCRNLLGLVRASLGTVARNRLIEAFDEYGVNYLH